MADESAERLTLNRRFEKPALEDLVRNPGEETVHVDYSSYSSLTSDYSPDGEPPDSGTGDVEIAAEEASEGVSDVYRDEEGCTHEVVEEDSEVESRVFDIALSGDRELTPMERVQMHRRYQVITADQYENERPYNDKYECTYFPGEHILAGFDGDLRPVADNMLWGVVHDGMSVKGMTKMYIRDLEGDSDFLVGTDSRKYLDAYEDWYGEDPE